ncbi:MAG TPA: OsmC family protein [Rhodanobacteraceae bacterium]|nr:OsmC family protein [Rhodanobacteraceae bacterium]
MSDTQSITLTLTQESDYSFRVSFDGDPIPDLLTDESPPLGRDAGPDPRRLLASAVGSCLASSLLFAMRKFKNAPGTIVARMTVHPTRNERGRLRIGSMAAEIQLPENAGDYQQIERILAQFEDFCVVTESVRAGIPVEVSVVDAEGAMLHGDIPSA